MDKFQMTKQQYISHEIMERVGRGWSVKDAFNAVMLDDGAYDRFVSDLYDALRAKAGLSA